MRIFTVDPDPERVYGLDIVRAAAILCVVYVHGFFLLAPALPPYVLRLMGMLIPDGVSIFFVLSGYLIGGILIRNLERGAASGANLGRFWVRRWLRTLPAYYLVLTILTAYHMHASGMDFAAVWKYFFFLQNFATPHPAFFAEAWSLAVEEWFYLLVPVLLFGSVRVGLSPRQAVIGVALLVIAWSLGFRIHRYAGMDTVSLAEFDLLFRKQVATRLDSLVWGVLGAALHHYHRAVWQWRPRLAFGAGLAMLVADSMLFTFRPVLGLPLNGYFCVLSFAVAAIGVLLTLPLLSGIRHGRGALCTAITFISTISYSMYLIHLNLVQFILVPATLKLLPLHATGLPLALLKLFLYFAYTVLGSALLYRYFERPTTALRRFAGQDPSPVRYDAQPAGVARR